MTIPASATVIEKEAFCNCKRLKCVTFAKDHRLENLRPGPISRAGTDVDAPDGGIEIQERAFHECENLAEVVFEEGR